MKLSSTDLAVNQFWMRRQLFRRANAWRVARNQGSVLKIAIVGKEREMIFTLGVLPGVEGSSILRTDPL
jgi:hypothetical protein